MVTRKTDREFTKNRAWLFQWQAGRQVGGGAQAAEQPGISSRSSCVPACQLADNFEGLSARPGGESENRGPFPRGGVPPGRWGRGAQGLRPFPLPAPPPLRGKLAMLLRRGGV